jgi:uncharacterized protein with NAD-binding domain and iron-sulfur cluster
MTRRVEQPQVYVIGAGVAGLTAAHELAERGFKVYVWDAAEDVRRPGTPAIGGMARTQWARVPVERPIGLVPTALGNDMIAALDPPIFQDLKPTETRLPSSELSPWPELYFAKNSARLTHQPKDERRKNVPGGTPARRLATIARKIAEYFKRLAKAVETNPGLASWSKLDVLDELYLDATVSHDEAANPPLAAQRARVVALALRGLLLKALNTKVVKPWTIERIQGGPEDRPSVIYALRRRGSKPSYHYVSVFVRTILGDVHATDRVRHPWQQRYVRIALRTKLLPGEHGYRLFPSFYRHLFDTMRRTPIYAERVMTPREFSAHKRDTRDEARDDIAREPTGRSVFDNLIIVDEHAFAAGNGGEPRSLVRSRTESVADLLDTLDMLQKDLGWSNQDLLLAQIKFLEYATSSKERRRSYEDISWSEFIELDPPEGSRFSECFRASMEEWPQALIGLRANKIDARTFGSTALQQFLDQIRPPGFRDGTLNGPTTTAWMDHWQRYLEGLNVEFRLGYLEKLEFREKQGALHLVPIFDEKLTPSMPAVHQPGQNPVYIVLALPVEQTWKIARALKAAAKTSRQKRAWADSDFPAVVKMLDGPGEPYEESFLERVDPPGPLQHFAGIQYFLDEDYRFLAGHVYYPGAAWGLTSISQTRYRQDHVESRYAYRGIVSVIIGTWTTKGIGGHPYPAWTTPNAKLATQCWEQIVAAYGEKKPPTARWYHVDRNLEVLSETKDEVRRRNNSPYLTTMPGRYPRWPGEVGRYRVHFGNLVLAGSFMKTSTRLVTMEAANESGRHAAMAVLRDWAAAPQDGLFVGVGPQIWEMDDRELRDLDYLKRLDARLYEEGLPHAFRILRLSEMVGASGTGGHPKTLVEALVRVTSSQGHVLTTFATRLRSLLGGAMEKSA